MTVADKLTKLMELRDAGALSEIEFSVEKQKILDERDVFSSVKSKKSFSRFFVLPTYLSVIYVCLVVMLFFVTYGSESGVYPTGYGALANFFYGEYFNWFAVTKPVLLLALVFIGHKILSTSGKQSYLSGLIWMVLFPSVAATLVMEVIGIATYPNATVKLLEVWDIIAIGICKSIMITSVTLCVGYSVLFFLKKSKNSPVTA